MSEHTPGPIRWTAPLDELAAVDEYRDKCLDEKDYSSANIGLEGESRAVLIPWDYEGYSAGIYIRPSDGRLLAAAYNSYDKHCGPRAVECAEADLLGDLLQACKLAVYNLDEAAQFGNARRGSNAGIWATLAREIRAVIAKAEGRKS